MKLDILKHVVYSLEKETSPTQHITIRIDLKRADDGAGVIVTRTRAEFIYKILVEHCDARQDDLEDFCRYHVTNDSDYTEWRFGGNMGTGGKFRTQTSTKGRNMWITCYSEESTPERRARIETVGVLLRELP